MKTYKPIRRIYLEEHNEKINALKNSYFIATGQWADGHLAYSRLDENMNVIPEDDGAYVQIRKCKLLLMVRV